MTGFKNNYFFVKKTIVYYDEPSCVEKGMLDTFEPITTQSSNFKNWKAELDLKTCIECHSRHGQIYGIGEVVDPEPPLHYNCRCDIIPMESIEAGMQQKMTKPAQIIGLNILANYRDTTSLKVKQLTLVGKEEDLWENILKPKC